MTDTAREATNDEHNAIWAALTMLAHAMDGKPLPFAGSVQEIHTCCGEETGLTIDQVWNLRDRMANITIHLSGLEIG